MNEENKRQQTQQSRNVLLSDSRRSGFILIIAIIIVAVLSGVLGAFKNGEFQRTYDFVNIDMKVEEVDLNDRAFSELSIDSRVIKFDKKVIYYDEILGESFEKTEYWYKGYYKNYFYSSPWFYLETLMNTITVIIFYVALVNFLIIKKKSKDYLFTKMTDEIDDLVSVRNDVPASSFEPFLDDWNEKRKIRQFKSNMKYKISKLERKTPFRIKGYLYKRSENGKLEYNPNEEFLNKRYRLFSKKRKIKKKVLKYLNKKQTLESFVTEGYIETNVLYEKVKYFKYIYPSFVYNGKNGIHKTTDEYSSMESDNRKLRKDLFSKIILGLALTSVLTTVLAFTLFKANENWLIIVFSVSLKMLPLVLQTILGIDYTNNYMKNQLLPTLKYRLNIISVYLSRKQDFEFLKEVKEISETGGIMNGNF